MRSFCPECGHAVEGITGASSAAPQPIVEEDERELWQGSPAAVTSPLAKRSVQYVLTNERLRVQSGILGKKSESIELFRERLDI